MTLTEDILRDIIRIDFGGEIIYGSDVVYNTVPLKFATVSFSLYDTTNLNRCADRIRIKEKYKPFYTATDENGFIHIDPDGWYNFYIGINDFTESKVDSCIEFVVCNSDEPDNESVYTIDLSEEEQKIIYKVLSEQCEKYLDKTCDELLKESRKEME